MTRRSPFLIAACMIAAAVLFPSPALAQHGHASGPAHGAGPAHGSGPAHGPGPVYGHGPGGAHVSVGVGVYYGSPYYYGGYGYYPWYPWGGPWYGGAYFGYGYGYGYGYPYPYYYDDSASLQLQVTPRQTEVFIDDHFAGIVDNFDGTFQRLHVEPGEHDLQLFLAGHRAVTQHIYVQPRATFRVKFTMEALGPGEPEPLRPVGAPRAQGPGPGQGPGPRASGDIGPPEGPAPQPRGGNSGAVAIRVQPVDAQVLIDGERWDGASGGDRLVVQLAPGPHTIEVRKDGFRDFMTEVDIRPGETAPLNVSLARPR